MGCRSDYLAQTNTEATYQSSARLLAYAAAGLNSMGRMVEIDPEQLAQADEYYAADKGQVEALCALVSGMSEDEQAVIVYNGRSQEARDLANWWDEHQAADLARSLRTILDDEKNKLIESAREKLTEAERKAVGI